MTVLRRLRSKVVTQLAWPADVIIKISERRVDDVVGGTLAERLQDFFTLVFAVVWNGQTYFTSLDTFCEVSNSRQFLAKMLQGSEEFALQAVKFTLGVEFNVALDSFVYFELALVYPCGSCYSLDHFGFLLIVDQGENMVREKRVPLGGLLILVVHLGTPPEKLRFGRSTIWQVNRALLQAYQPTLVEGMTSIIHTPQPGHTALLVIAEQGDLGRRNDVSGAVYSRCSVDGELGHRLLGDDSVAGKVDGV